MSSMSLMFDCKLCQIAIISCLTLCLMCGVVWCGVVSPPTTKPTLADRPLLLTLTVFGSWRWNRHH